MHLFLKNRPVLSFLLLTFFVTYLFWFLPVFIEVPKDVALALSLIGGCGPLLAGYLITVNNSSAKITVHSKPLFIGIFLLALGVLLLRLSMVENTGQNKVMPTLNSVGIPGYLLFTVAFLILALNASNVTNKSLKENYIKSFLPEKGKLKWYILGFVLIPVMSLAAYGLGAILRQPLTEIFIDLNLKYVIGFLSTLLFFGSNEEFGWRGFMQKEMQKKNSALITALVISFFWSLWHLPLHYNGFYSTGGFIDLLPRFVWMIPLTVIYSWLYNRSQYALLAAMILHASMNNAKNAFGTSEWIEFFLTFAVAICLVVYNKMWKKKEFAVT